MKKRIIGPLRSHACSLQPLNRFETKLRGGFLCPWDQAVSVLSCNILSAVLSCNKCHSFILYQAVLSCNKCHRFYRSRITASISASSFLFCFFFLPISLLYRLKCFFLFLLKDYYSKLSFKDGSTDYNSKSILLCVFLLV